MEAQTSSTSEVAENETSNTSFTNNCDLIITKKMLIEEQLLEAKTVSEEQKLRKKIQEEKRKEEEELCFKRLHLLLSRSSVYAKFMAEKLQKYEEMKKSNKENFENPISENEKIANQRTKRKAAFSSVNKKSKTNHNIADMFKNQNRNAKLAEENGQNVTKDTSKLSLHERQPKLLTGGIMREYQIEGYEWLKTLYENGVNGILADEMGLGKTIQCVAFISYLISMGVSGPFFVCGPLSTVPNWYSEFQRFAPDVPVIVYHGDKVERKELKKKIIKKVQKNDVCCFPVIITSYQIALSDASILESVEWKLLVIDEAHRIKNFQCKLIQTLKKYKAIHRLLLTGTPLQNNLTELWSLLNFILPEIFDDLQIFQSWFDISRLSENGLSEEIIAQEQEKQIVSTIHQILTPFLLRRTKSDVELSLPPKRTVVVHAPMTQLQQKYYTGVLNCLIGRLKKQEKGDLITTDEKSQRRKSTKSIFYGEDEDSNSDDDIIKTDEKCQSIFYGENDDSNFDKLLNAEAKENLFSQVCNGNNKKLLKNETYPLQTAKEKMFLQIFKEEAVFSEIKLQLKNIHMCLRKICCHPYLISYPLDPSTHDYLVDENIVKTSGKMLVLDILLTQLQKQGHKVLLFSQFISMLHILEDYCTFRKFKYANLYGSMSLAEREEQLKAFNENDSIFIFLISTRAGGLGINLTAADTVIIYDTDWNPQGDLQAQDRCHRIGQTKPVIVYHLVAPNTYDERVYNSASAKRKLEKVIIQKGRFNSKNGVTRQQNAITKEELLDLLESSDANGFVNAANFSIPPEELESILDRSHMVGKADL